jgi:DNA/RNA endonuclease YhcR with UshA esterase domain
MNANPLPRVFRYVALVLGTVGLGLLYLTALHREIPVVKIGEIKPMMNFATVRVAGKVSGDAQIFKEGEHVRSLRFMVDDGSGEILVQAYKAQAQALVDKYGLPRTGDRVEVAGSLSVSADDDVTMRLQVPEQLVLTRADTKPMALKDVNDGMIGRDIVVEGNITKVIAPKPGSKAPWTVVVTDAGGQQEITFWQDIYDEIRDKILLAPGAPVRVHVAVRSYKEKLQLALSQGVDIEFIAAGAAKSMVAGPGAPAGETPLTAVGDVTAAMVGKTVKVSGRVTQVKEPEAGSKAPYEVALQEGDKQVVVVYWDTVARHLDDSSKPVVGALMTAKGQVNEYKGRLQIKIGNSADLTLVDVTPASKPQVEPAREVGIGTITTAMVGKRCTVKGTLGEARSIKGGVIYPMTDGSGSVKLVLWDKSVSGPGRDALAAGCKVVATGEIVEYKGDLELVPASIEAIRIEAKPSK